MVARAGHAHSRSHRRLHRSGGPLVDLGVRTDKSIAAVTSHAWVLFLLLAAWGSRYRWLQKIGDWSSIRTALLFTVAGLAPMVLVWLVATFAPGYGSLLTREAGPIEPLQVALYLSAAWVAATHARVLRDQGAEHRPYRLVVAVCFFAVLDELDYLGIVRPVVGRIEDMHVGALHDLVRLARRVPEVGLALAALTATVAVWLVRGGYLSPRLLRAEAIHPTSVPLWIGALALVIAQILDFDADLLPWAAAVPVRLEEPLELLAVVFLNWGLLLKLVRDRPERRCQR